ncbi:Hsp20/alpha crystallin family protein [Clostridium sp. WILCCON 0269]|uniref:Hsp20/alpha crystallin family protein n=1 Tax=Candidatus Clostridium eludens TaxID=3381663 RepID=A0ABW8SNN6_9CLOT
MQINTNTFNQQGVNAQQLKFIPMSSNISNSGAAVNYGITAYPGLNNTFGTPQAMANQMINSQIGLSPYQMVTTPYIFASQANQMASGVFNNMICHHHHPMIHSITVQPTIDISETSSDIMVSAYVSNSAINDLKLNVTDDSLTISGTLLNGSNQFVLNRTIPLSTSIRAEAVDATLQSGVLEIRLPKSEKSNRVAQTCKNTNAIMINS